MPWYQAVPLIGSAIALSVVILFRPSSEARLMLFTILIGGLVLVSAGIAVKDVIDEAYTAAWLASGR
jgi:hypothetical protein